MPEPLTSVAQPHPPTHTLGFPRSLVHRPLWAASPSADPAHPPLTRSQGTLGPHWGDLGDAAPPRSKQIPTSCPRSHTKYVKQLRLNLGASRQTQGATNHHRGTAKLPRPPDEQADWALSANPVTHAITSRNPRCAGVGPARPDVRVQHLSRTSARGRETRS